MDQKQPQQPPHPQQPEMLRKSSSFPSSSRSEGEDCRGGEEGERAQGLIQGQIEEELAPIRSSLNSLQRNLLTALNALNSMELIMAVEEESSGGLAEPSRHSPPTAEVLRLPQHAVLTATTMPRPENPTTTSTGYAFKPMRIKGQ